MDRDRANVGKATQCKRDDDLAMLRKQRFMLNKVNESHKFVHHHFLTDVGTCRQHFVTWNANHPCQRSKQITEHGL
ncbi:Uncharacterised protein [Vibrio cholerae]|uniref:Uncharacterized protein n=1 Tax=Vibrio cholerae TaxID=666 RepID=A0A655X1S5_VIBCL|nr:Uncharacterised protein [Vibrio cholerae]CSC52271.1 Uncharacterised protein [Vibrio cholerae]